MTRQTYPGLDVMQGLEPQVFRVGGQPDREKSVIPSANPRNLQQRSSNTVNFFLKGNFFGKK